MNYQQIMIELPQISDESAASLQKFIQALMYAIDEHYHRQIHRHYKLDFMKNPSCRIPAAKPAGSIH
jgi:hypothetical protein